MDISPSSFFSALLGAIVGIAVGITIEWWKSEREDLLDLSRGFCALVAEAADAGAEFQLTSASEPKSQFLSVRLIGFQNRISGYRTILIDRIYDDSLDEIDDELSRFFSTLTGRNADDPARLASREAAINVHDAASAAIISIRRAVFARLSFSARLTRFVTNHYPNRRVALKSPTRRGR